MYVYVYVHVYTFYLFYMYILDSVSMSILMYVYMCLYINTDFHLKTQTISDFLNTLQHIFLPSNKIELRGRHYQNIYKNVNNMLLIFIKILLKYY